MTEHPRQGSFPRPNGSTRFRVWAPNAKSLAIRLTDTDRPLVEMQSVGNGYWEALVADVGPGANYLYHFADGRERPDPAARYQPFGVHGPSQVVAREFAWTDAGWRGIAWGDYVIYELHVGVYTTDGTFEAIIPQLDRLVRLGITAVQLMSVAQFPGQRNWGYDGVHPFAPQNSYGGPAGLKRLVAACHARGLAVVLDVVYNHLGPEGNYLAEFGPYFTDRYRTPWGPAVNFDGPGSDAVRQFFIDNALYWLDEFHIDALRLDATHAMFDRRPHHFLRELASAVQGWREVNGRQAFLFAEDSSDDPRICATPAEGGYGLDAQYLDDFARALHARLTGDDCGFYRDFGSLADFAKAYQAGFVMTGQYSNWRGCRWGADGSAIPADRFVAMAQTHDTIGNRADGARPGRYVDLATLKLMAAITILSPAIPLLFMGEEYDEPAPFYYFTSHEDAGLGEAVRKGRQHDFVSFGWPAAMRTAPHPQSVDAFERCKLRVELADEGQHAVLWRVYQELLRLRRALPAIRQPDREQQSVRIVQDDVLIAERWDGEGQIAIVYNFVNEPRTLVDELAEGVWQVVFDSAAMEWGGAGGSAFMRESLKIVLVARSCVVMRRL